MNNTPNKVAEFNKVSFEQFWTSLHFSNDNLKEFVKSMFDGFDLPKRSTTNSAGYDFYSPVHFVLKPGETLKIPTGIKAIMQPNVFFAIFPRSSVGMKYKCTLDNTVGIIDADFSSEKSIGHIMLQFTNHHKRSIFPWVNKKHTWVVNPNDRICQGIFIPYGITNDDLVNTERTGGMGSTGQ